MDICQFLSQVLRNRSIAAKRSWEARVSDDVLEALGISQDVLEGDGAWITVSRQFDDVGDSFKLRVRLSLSQRNPKDPSITKK